MMVMGWRGIRQRPRNIATAREARAPAPTQSADPEGVGTMLKRGCPRGYQPMLIPAMIGR